MYDISSVSIFAGQLHWYDAIDHLQTKWDDWDFALIGFLRGREKSHWMYIMGTVEN